MFVILLFFWLSTKTCNILLKHFLSVWVIILNMENPDILAEIMKNNKFTFKKITYNFRPIKGLLLDMVHLLCIMKAIYFFTLVYFRVNILIKYPVNYTLYFFRIFLSMSVLRSAWKGQTPVPWRSEIHITSNIILYGISGRQCFFYKDIIYYSFDWC